jgi:hypothetical protein
MRQKKTTVNSRFVKAGARCFYESEVLNSSFPAKAVQVVHLMKFSAENPRLCKAADVLDKQKKKEKANPKISIKFYKKSLSIIVSIKKGNHEHTPQQKNSKENKM